MIIVSLLSPLKTNAKAIICTNVKQILIKICQLRTVCHSVNVLAGRGSQYRPSFPNYPGAF